MESRRTRLRPPTRELRDTLYEGAMSGEMPWLWREFPEMPHAFDEAMWSGMLVQYAIEDRRTGEQVGLVGAYGANHFHRFCYATLTLLPEHRRRVWPLEGVLLFGNLLFTKYVMENVYADTTSDLYGDFSSGAGRLFTELGRYPNRLLVAGQRTDVIIAGISREQWFETAAPLFERCLPDPGDEH